MVSSDEESAGEQVHPKRRRAEASPARSAIRDACDASAPWSGKGGETGFTRSEAGKGDRPGFSRGGSGGRGKGDGGRGRDDGGRGKGDG
eukprot:5159529-Pleurochrysis_carterae.AAC.1